MVSNLALHEQGLCSELEKVRAEHDQAVSRTAEAAKMCEAAKKKACFEGKRALFAEEESRTLEAMIKAVEG